MSCKYDTYGNYTCVIKSKPNVIEGLENSKSNEQLQEYITLLEDNNKLVQKLEKLKKLKKEVTFHFKTSTGGGIQLSEITFYNSSGNEITIESTEVPTHNSDGLINKLDTDYIHTDKISYGIDATYDGNINTKWNSRNTLGSVTFILESIPDSYIFTAANDNHTHNRTPVTWDVYYDIYKTSEEFKVKVSKPYQVLDNNGSKFQIPNSKSSVLAPVQVPVQISYSQVQIPNSQVQIPNSQVQSPNS